MRILHISIYPEQGELYSRKGGVASYTKNLITSHTDPSHEMSILCDIDTDETVYIEDDITVIRKRKHGISSFRTIARYLVSEKKTYDVIHLQHELQLFGSLLVGYMILLLPFFVRGKNRILTSHHAIDYTDIDADFVKNHGQQLPVFVIKIAFRILYMLYRLWDNVIVHEEVHKKRLSTQYGLDITKIQIIPHGVESQKSYNADEAKKHLGLQEYENIVFYMGYVTGYKDLKVLIEGYALWLEQNPNSILVLGAGPEKNPKKIQNIWSTINHYKI